MSIRRKYDCRNEDNNEEILRRMLCFNSKVEGRAIIRDLWIARKKKIEHADTITNLKGWPPPYFIYIYNIKTKNVYSEPTDNKISNYEYKELQDESWIVTNLEKIRVIKDTLTSEKLKGCSNEQAE